MAGMMIIIAMAVMLTTGAAWAQTGADGLVGYWAFDEGEGNQAVNSVRSTPDIFGKTGAAEVVGPVWTEGVHGGALDFAGGETAVIVDKTAELNCEQQITIAAWVKLENPEARGMILSHEFSYRLCVNQGRQARVRLQLNLDGNWAQNWLVSATSLETGRWHHVAGTYDGTERRIYLDGKLDASAPATGMISLGRGYVIGAQNLKYDAKHVLNTEQAGRYTVAAPFPGVLDEVRVWNRALSADELKLAADEDRATLLAMLPPEQVLYLYPVRSVMMSGGDSPWQVAVFNGGAQPYRGSFTVEVADASGAPLRDTRREVDLATDGRVILDIPAEDRAAGSYIVTVSSAGRRLFEMPTCVLEPVARQRVGEPELASVLRVNLSADLGPDALCDDGTSHVVHAAAGDYRETGEEKFSRFVVRLPLRRTGLHLVRVTYPDDRERTCEICSWSPDENDRFNAHTGYFTGDDFPLSGEMKTFEFVMWARDVNQALVFTTWLEGQPAAASEVEVFEIAGRLPARPASELPSRRLVGHYWEDAQPLSRCFGGGAPELMDFDRVARNLCDYFDYTGQNLLMHPLCWYEGPICNSLVEKRGGKGGFHNPTAGWVDIVLRRFEERGFKFYGLMNVYRLPSLIGDMNADLASIQAGAPTYNVVTRDNEVWIGTRPHRPPIFNALHPVVQNAVLALVAEIAEKYGDSPAFGGIGFHLTMPEIFQLGGLEGSYDDWTAAQFAADTGIEPPVDAGDPERFGKRYDWLMANARDEWVRWRCERIADFYGRAAAILREKREDLQLVITILEPPMPIIDPYRRDWMAGKQMIEMTREAGVGPELLAHIPGVVIQKRLGPTAKKKRLVLGVTRGRWGCEPPSPESIQATREMDLDQEQSRAYRTTREFGVFLYNRYFESSVGRDRPLECEWYQSIPWRASAVVPAAEHFMEYYARSMAIFDPSFIAIGGFTNGTVGHEGRVARFAEVFRQLPQGDWREIAGLGENLAGRSIEADGVRWVWVVNNSSETRRVLVHDTDGLAPVGQSPPLVEADGGRAAELRPYELAAWATVAQ
jgi:hypothetical protein